MSVTVIKAGALTTVQDGGRYGFQKYGVSVGGAMDLLALSIANVLVGNPPDAAALEITLVGPELRFESGRYIAVCGGDLNPTLNDEALPMWRPVFVPAGSILHFGFAKRGCRAYLAFDGGIDVPVVLGGASTYLRAGFGGFNGRALASGDRLHLGKASLRLNERMRQSPKIARWYASKEWADMSHSSVVRVIPGSEIAAFTEESIQRFFDEPYTVSSNSDRMGYRLKGANLEYSYGNMLSEAVAFGTIQVPADGAPIVLMADRQTTGGYPRIGQVAAVDLSIMAQRKPGDNIWFVPITLEDAERLLWIRDQQFTLFRLAVRHAMEKEGMI